VTYIPLIMISVFCAGVLAYYGRQTLRLQRLLNSGTTTQATVVGKERLRGGESVVHYFVTYEFPNFRGETVTHQEDLNRAEFFDSIEVGETIDILYERQHPDNSYPLSQIRADHQIARAVTVGIIVLWVVMVLMIT
jgi:hypothetical protein